MAYGLRTRIVTDSLSYVTTLAAEHRRQQEQTKTPNAKINQDGLRSERARMLWRKREEINAAGTSNSALTLLEKLDPGFEYLEHLGWQHQPDQTSREEPWLPSWDNRGGLVTWLEKHFKRWRQEWVDEGKMAPLGDEDQGDEQVEDEQRPKDDELEKGGSGTKTTTITGTDMNNTDIVSRDEIASRDRVPALSSSDTGEHLTAPVLALELATVLAEGNRS
nr:uncharacterized protein CTRU02_15089 [Colletotrichum truncatum]KAF6781449.1 hypothetical protein CTRU02_15089 [Colletotrichum truncatum]